MVSTDHLNSEDRKAVAQARLDAEQHGVAAWQDQLVRTAFEVLLGDRVDAGAVDGYLDEMNLSAFITEGKVDFAKVRDRADIFAASGTDGNEADPATPHSVQAGRDLWNRSRGPVVTRSASQSGPPASGARRAAGQQTQVPSVRFTSASWDRIHGKG